MEWIKYYQYIMIFIDKMNMSNAHSHVYFMYIHV